MRAQRIIAAEEVVALAVYTYQDLSSQDDRTLPKPRRLLAILGWFGILGLIAQVGQGPARFATAAGGVSVLTLLVTGSGGKAITGLLQAFTGLLSTPGSNVGGLVTVTGNGITVYAQEPNIGGGTKPRSGRQAAGVTLTPPTFTG